MADFVRQYGVAANFYVPVVKASSTDFAASADWTPAAGDVKVIIDGVDNGNITTLPIAVSARAVWKFAASAAEMTGADIAFIVVDSATKAITDQAIVVSTFGHQSAADSRGIIRRATAVSAAATTLDLDASASSVDDFYNGNFVYIKSASTGAGQVRQIIDYTGANQRATLYSAGPPVQGTQFVTTPTGTIVFEIYPFAIQPTPVTTAAGAVAAYLPVASTPATAIITTSATGDQILAYLATLLANKITETSGTQVVFRQNGTTTVAAAAISDDGTTFTRGAPA